MTTIVSKPDLGVDPTKGWGLGLHGLTRVKPEKLKKILEVLIFYMKKLIHVEIDYTCCKKLSLKDYPKKFFIPHWKDTILFF